MRTVTAAANTMTRSRRLTLAGVFTTRSPHRPNPLGLHQVTVAAIDGSRVLVRSLEAVDGTPILDIKGVLNPDIQQR